MRHCFVAALAKHQGCPMLARCQTGCNDKLRGRGATAPVPRTPQLRERSSLGLGAGRGAQPQNSSGADRATLEREYWVSSSGSSSLVSVCPRPGFCLVRLLLSPSSSSSSVLLVYFSAVVVDGGVAVWNEFRVWRSGASTLGRTPTFTFLYDVCLFAARIGNV